MNSSGPALAPGPAAANVSAPSPAGAAYLNKLDCAKGNYACNAQVTDNQIVTSIWFDLIFGAIFLLLFGLLRGRFAIYRSRELLPQVWIKPPPMPLGGFNHLWSWLAPIFTTSDMDLLHSAGLDALIISWVNLLGIQIFLPLAILGCVALIPVYRIQGDRVQQNALDNVSSVASTSSFMKLTASNLGHGSAYYWFPFVFVYIATAWICWLLTRYYKSYLVLRQRYVMCGEEGVNEWTQQYVGERPSKARQLQGRQNPFKQIRRLVDPTVLDSIVEEGPELEHKGLASASVQRLARMTAKTSFSSSGSSTAGLGSSPRAHTGMRRRKGSPLRPRVLIAEPFADSDTAGSPPLDGVEAPHAGHGGGLPVHHDQGYGLRDQQSPRHVDGIDADLRRTIGSTVPLVSNAQDSSLLSPRDSMAALEPRPPSNPSLPPSNKAHHRPVAEAHEQSHPFLQNHPGLHHHSPSSLPQESQPAATQSSDSSVRFANLPSPQHPPRLRRPVAEAQEGPLVSPSLEGGHPTGVPGRDSLAESAAPLDGSAPLPGMPPQDALPGQGLGNGVLESRPNSTSAPTQQPQKVASPDRGPWWRRRFLQSGPGPSGIGTPGTAQLKRLDGAATPMAVVHPHLAMVRDRLQAEQDASSDALSQDTVPPSAFPPASISKYENRDLELGDRDHAPMVRWWRNEVPNKHSEDDEKSLVGKPPVRFRKVVNTTTDDGRMIGVNAQQYAVLVMDVPNLARERLKLAKRQERQEARAAKRQKRTEDKEARRAPAAGSWWPGLRQRHASNGMHPSHPDAITNADLKSVAQKPVKPRDDTADFVLEDKDETTSEQVKGLSGNSNLPAPFLQSALHQAEHADEAADFHEVDDMDAELLVGETFRRLFPDSFQHVMPIRNHQSVDLLLIAWDQACAKLERAEASYERIGGVKRPTHRLRCCGNIEPEVDSINFWAARVRQLETDIVEERQRVLQAPPCGAFFVFFNNQRDAAIAAQVNLHPEDGHTFRVQEAPGPEEVCWTTLWRDWRTREIREIISIPFIVFMMLVPVGLFTGAVAELTVAICGSSGFFNNFYSSWYCGSNSVWRSLVTGALPPILLTLWQALVMPNAFYRLAVIESQSVSLSALDRRIATLFVFWDVFNVFLGGMFAGSAFSQLGVIINKPGSIPSVIGTALPASSNFFINTLILKAFTMMPLRMFFPHIGALAALFQAMGCCKPKSERDRFMTLSPHSIRHGREIGSMMLVFVIALAYASSSPLIMVFALAYFFASWIMWRHHLLYIYERCYESGGRMWDKVFDYMVWCLFILEFFTACVLLANAAFVQMSILLATMTPFLWKFNRYCKVRYAHAVRHMPLETAANAPTAHIDPFIYMPPALRSRAQGWYPECGKAWESWGMPAYTF